MRRVLRPGGRVAFQTIAMAPGLDDEQRSRVGDISPEADSGPGYPALLQTAGFVDIDVVDVTTSFLETLGMWKKAWEEEAEGIAELLGAEDFRERMVRRHLSLEAVGDGLMQRFLISATAPDR